MLKVPGGPAARQTPLKFCIVDPPLPRILDAAWIHTDFLGATRHLVLSGASLGKSLGVQILDVVCFAVP
jgi:hypothetical protein